jgi:hypothetical protein
MVFVSTYNKKKEWTNNCSCVSTHLMDKTKSKNQLIGGSGGVYSNPVRWLMGWISSNTLIRWMNFFPLSTAS